MENMASESEACVMCPVVDCYPEPCPDGVLVPQYTPSGCPLCPSCVEKPRCPVLRCMAPSGCAPEEAVARTDENGCELCPTCPSQDGAQDPVKSSCASYCPRTCDEPGPKICPAVCVEGFVCEDPDRILHNGKCILPSACPPSACPPCPIMDCAAPPAGCNYKMVADSCGCLVCGPLICDEATTPEADHPPMPGGWSVIQDTQADSVVAAAQCAVGLLQAATNSAFRMVLSSVVQGKQQVVNGMNYDMVLETQSTDCLESAAADAICNPTASSSRFAIKFYSNFAGECSHPMSGPSFRAVDMPTTAAPATTRGGLLGGWSPLDASSADAQAAGSCAISLLQSATNSMFKMALTAVVEGRVQVVAGRNYNLVVDTQLTTCYVSSETASCPVQGTPTRYNIRLFIGLDGSCAHPASGPQFSAVSASPDASVPASTVSPTEVNVAASGEGDADETIHKLIVPFMLCVAVALIGLMAAVFRRRWQTAAPSAAAATTTRRSAGIYNPLYQEDESTA